MLTQRDFEQLRMSYSESIALTTLVETQRHRSKKEALGPVGSSNMQFKKQLLMFHHIWRTLLDILLTSVGSSASRLNTDQCLRL